SESSGYRQRTMTVWTIKRILILVIALLVCLGGFAIYTLLLGAFDARPPLPITFLPSSDYSPLSPDERLTPLADQKLEQSFGPACKELKRPIRLWLPEKGVAFAAGDFTIDQTDGRVKLAPFSAALYHKAKSPGAYPEISTIRCDVAILTLDRPVSS